MKEIKKILVIRFRQVGDSILGVALCSTLKRSFPNAEIHYVLNKGIASLYQGHPDIDKIITFDNEENRSFYKYVRKVWNVVNDNHYDVIIDMRSTLRTLLFSLFSLKTPFRIGRTKKYAYGLLNHRLDTYNKELSLDMAKRNLMLAKPLENVSKIHYTSDFKLYITEEERMKFHRYMEENGIDFARPVVLIGVTTKLSHKKWNENFMKEVLQRILSDYKDYQLIFNYAPGKEEAEVRRIYEELGKPSAVKIDLQASSLRELVALCGLCSFYFGNEGGTRHIVQAMGCPSFSIFSPSAYKTMWLPKNETLAEGICPDDILSKEEQKKLSYQERFDLITPDIVYSKLSSLLNAL